MNHSDLAVTSAAILYASIGETLDDIPRLEDKFRAAFNESKNFWMSTDEDVRFKAGIGAVMLDVGADSEDYRRITRELDQLNFLTAALTGVPVNFEAVEDELADHEPIGILKIWKEVKNK